MEQLTDKEREETIDRFVKRFYENAVLSEAAYMQKDYKQATYHRKRMEYYHNKISELKQYKLV